MVCLASIPLNGEGAGQAAPSTSARSRGGFGLARRPRQTPYTPDSPTATSTCTPPLTGGQPLRGPHRAGAASVRAAGRGRSRVRGPGQTASLRSARAPRAPCSEADDCAAWSRRLSSTRPLRVEDSWEDPKASPVHAATHPRLRPSAPEYVDAVVATPTPYGRRRSPRFPHNQAVF